MFAIITFSTWLTLIRIGLSPCVVIAMVYHAWSVAFVLFLIAALTDFFDGYCARLYNQETQLGKILDPIADKILLFSTLMSLFFLATQSTISLWFVLLCIIKDCILLGGGYFLLYCKKSTVFNPSLFSKAVTALFMIFLIYGIFLNAGYIVLDVTQVLEVLLAIGTMFIVFDYGYQFYIRLKE